MPQPRDKEVSSVKIKCLHVQFPKYNYMLSCYYYLPKPQYFTDVFNTTLNIGIEYIIANPSVFNLCTRRF